MGTPYSLSRSATTTAPIDWMEATERSISAQMMTSVRPAAMMPMFDDWSRMFIMFETVKKFSAVMERKRISRMSARMRPYLEKPDATSEAMSYPPLAPAAEPRALSVFTSSLIVPSPAGSPLPGLPKKPPDRECRKDHQRSVLHFTPPLRGLDSRGESQTQKPSGLCEG